MAIWKKLRQIMPRSLNKQIAIAVLAAYLIVIILAFTVLSFKILGLKHPGDTLNLIQTIAGLVLIPIAIIGFFMTIDDLRKSQQVPDLDLYWDHNNVLVKSLNIKRPISCNYPTPQLILHNRGTSLSSLYQITLIFPPGLEQSLNGKKWRAVTPGAPTYVFTSSEEYVSFPDARVGLGNINFSVAKKLPNKFEIDYVIYADRAQYVKGKLNICFSS